MKTFLTLKHWQLFLLLVGLPMILEVIAFVFAISTRDGRMVFIFFFGLILLSTGLCFSWFYALGTNLFKRVPATVKMSLTRFKLFLFTAFGYIIFFMVFMATMFSNVLSGGRPDFAVFAIIFPLHFFYMFCVCYCLYFNAKALKTIELQRAVTFNDYAGEFFLLWFFPVGVWIIQPRINKLFTTLPDGSGNSPI